MLSMRTRTDRRWARKPPLEADEEAPLESTMSNIVEREVAVLPAGTVE